MTHPIRTLIFAGFALVALVLIGKNVIGGKEATEVTPTEVTSTEAKTTDVEPSDAPIEATPAEVQATEVQAAIVLTDNDKEIIAEFDKRTREYAGLHSKLEASLPKMPEKATPEQIDKHQKAMVALIQEERKGAKTGEFFTPGMVALITRASGATVAGVEGKETKANIMDENPGTLPNVNVNDKYPDGPVTSMPAELLETLPKLPEGQEYRFFGKRLVLVDACCAVVLDVTPNVLP